MTGLLSLADVAAFYGSATAIVDFGSARPFAGLSLVGLGTPKPLRPLGSTDVELVPIATGERVTARAYWGDRLAQSDTIDRDTAYFALVLSASGQSLILPARLKDPVHGGAEESLPVDDVAMTTIMFAQRAAAWYGDEAHPIEETRSVAVAADRTSWLVATEAGTIGGTAHTTGIHQLVGAGPFAAAGGLRGWILATRIAEVG